MIVSLQHHLLDLTVLLLLSYLTVAATTLGPLAPLTIHSLPTFSFARPCAAACLVYRGRYLCEYNPSHHDLGVDLGCGCYPNNACYCSDGYQSSATSNISSCVSAKCSTLGNVESDVTSMLELYGGYCATANVETGNAPKSTYAVTTTAGETLIETGTRLREEISGTPAETDVSSTKTTEVGGEANENEGLSKSDIIALATGLGVGIPSLVVGVLALWFQLRKKREKQQSDIMIGTTPSHSRTHILPAPPPPATGYGQNQVYELRGWR